jgi:XTP/dITP diphosphohydrolase
MSALFFASSNPHKFAEVCQILSHWKLPVGFAQLELTEIQADHLEPIAEMKAREASRRLNARALVEDAGLFIESLRGFPGPYSAYVFRTLGIEGVLTLLRDEKRRRAHFRSVIGYCEPGAVPECFTASVDGTIAMLPRGGGWGYDPIFVPDGARGLTYGELEGEKNHRSHRRKSLEMFAECLLQRA